MGTLKDRDQWRLRIHDSGSPNIVIMASFGVPFALIMLLLILIGLPEVALVTMFFLIIILIFVKWLNSDIEKRSFQSFPFMSLHDYPLGFQRVATAIGLLLVGRRARFENVHAAWRLLTLNQIAYHVYDMDGVMMLVIVRTEDDAPKGSRTQVRLLHDMKDEGMRKQVEKTVDSAITNPFSLRYDKYYRSSGPKLNIYKGSTYRKDHGGIA